MSHSKPFAASFAPPNRTHTIAGAPQMLKIDQH
jgi:hypothetical protein